MISHSKYGAKKTIVDNKFIVPGDPVGYLRMTQGQKGLLKIPLFRLSEDKQSIVYRIRKYEKWKEWVFVQTSKSKCPRSPRQKVYVNVMAYFRNGKHPDPDNVLKGILDALFKNDNKVACSIDFDYDKDNPRCEIEITEVQ